MRPRTIAIVQARMGSSRLPGKMLLPLAGKTVLGWAVERVERARLVDELVLATSVQEQDDLLEEFAAWRGLACFRGSENDVLDRFYRTALAFDAQMIVRLTGDNPLVDGEFVDWVVSAYHETDADYVAAVPGEEWGLPIGLAVEVFSFAALSAAWKENGNLAWREHVTPYIRRNPDRFQIRYLTAPVDYSWLRLTVDTPEDLALMCQIFEHFGNESFSWQEALEAVQRHPEWMDVNCHICQQFV